MKNCPDRKAITEVASSCDELRRERLRTSNIAMTVIAALINAEPAASRQPVSRRPDVDVASLSSPDSKLRARRRKKREKGESGITTRWKIGDAIKREGGNIYIDRVAIREIKVPPSEANGKPPPFLLHLSFLLTLHLRVLFAAE